MQPRSKAHGPGPAEGVLGGGFRDYRAGWMQHPESGFPRTPLPRTRVNNGKRKGRSCTHRPRSIASYFLQAL